MEDSADGIFEMAGPAIVGHGGAGLRVTERNAAFHTAGKIGPRGGGSVRDGVVKVASHDEDVAVGLEGVPVAVRTGWRPLGDVAR